MRIALISCGKQKLVGSHPAKELYISTLFRFAHTHAVRYFDKVFILSAKYGLLSPDEVIADYDLTLTGMRDEERKRWADSVLLQMKEHVRNGDELHFFCGSKYRAHLIDALRDTHQCIVPLHRMGIGSQLAWYKRRLAS
jgi:hypothetical protein